MVLMDFQSTYAVTVKTYSFENQTSMVINNEKLAIMNFNLVANVFILSTTLHDHSTF